MRAIIFVAIFAIVFVNAGILCNLCIDLVNTLEKLLTVNGAEKVKEYIDTLCNKASGYIASLCTKVLDFGVDKLVDMIINKVDPNAICETIHAC
ncbi:Invapore A [Entamoeba marina]